MSTQPTTTEVFELSAASIQEKRLAEYKRLIEGLNKAQSREIFSNGRPEHAAAIFAEFFRTARVQVHIFCRNLKSEVYGRPEVLEALASALGRKVRVSILCQEPPETPSIVNLAGTEGLTVQMVTKDEAKKTKVNFAVMDHRAFRIEVNNDNQEAVASMNRPDVCKDLLKGFGDFAHGCVEVTALGV